MEHSEFIEKYNKNKISVNIDKNKAGFLYSKPGLMPNHLRQKQLLIRTFAFLCSFGGIVLFFFISWYYALIILIVGLYQFPLAQSSAAKGVLEASLSDPEIFSIAKSENVLLISEIAKEDNNEN